MNITNKKARFEYEFLDSYTAGIKLVGSEVKSIKNNEVSINEAYCVIIDDEIFIKNMNVKENTSPYSHKSKQDRKLLLKKREIRRLKKYLIKGLTIIPYRIYINDKHIIKMEIVLGRGKKNFDKRQTIKNRDIERDIQKNFK